MLRLFLEGKELELTEDVQFAITKQFEDLSNPTTIINDWSKTVSIPFTHNNDKIFGYFFRPDKLTTYMPSSNYLSTAPSRIRKWDGSDYVDDSLSGGNIVCDINAQYVQVGFQYDNWKYSNVKNFTCNNDWHSFEFNYIPEEDYRFEFSFRDMASDAPNNEVYFVQWDLYDRSLVENETYVVSFKHKKSGNNYIIYDYSLSKKQSLTGINFDPSKKLDFRLEWNGATLMTGYAKLNEIKQTAGKGTYEITLFGQLGKILQELKKITFDTSADDTGYLIHGEDYVGEYINSSLVALTWGTSNQNQYYVKKKNETGYYVTDIIGFAPNNSFSEGFDYTTYQNGVNSSKQFTEVLGDAFTQATGISPDTVIPNGMLPREIGEYRSYLQLPFIYWNKLFQIIQHKAEDLTGYKFELDPLWFNKKNPYWYDLVYMLKAFNTKKGNSMINQYRGVMSSPELVWSRNQGRIPYSTPQDVNYQLNVISEKTPKLSNNKFKIGLYDNVDITSHTISFYLTGEMYAAHDILFTKDNFFIYTLKFTGSNGHVESKDVVVYRETASTDILTAVTTMIAGGAYGYKITDDNRYGKNFPNLQSSSTYGWYISVGGDNLVKLNRYTFGDEVTVTATARWYNNHAVFGAAGSTSEFCWFSNSNITLKYEILEDVFSSNSYFTLNHLWNNKFKPFDEIIKYCKKFRIFIKVDDIEKKIKFITSTSYFEDYSITDWTNKVDKSKDFVIKPITFDKKYVLFNYKDSESNLGKQYKDKYGVNYGEYRLVTNYNFNTDTNKLFDELTPSIVTTDNVLSWNNINHYHSIVYSFPSEIYVYNRDKDNKQVDIFGAYYFKVGIKEFSTESALHMTSVSISDDTTFQQNNSTYFYSQSYSTLPITHYPHLDVVKGNYLSIFNVPTENYTYINNYSNKSTIYSNFWENYINERYNLQNKILTCYVRIKPSEFSTFDFSKFVKVDNQLCIVNKIYDYDITSSQTTKVDLVTVQDLDRYTNNDFLHSLDTLDLDWVGTIFISGMSGMSGTVGTFSSNSQVTFENGTTTRTVGGIKLTIVNNDTVHYETVSKYVDKEDLSANITLKNKTGNTATFNIVRYATYPYPEIKLYESDGETERSTIYPGTRNYKLGWYGTETYGSENKPTVTIDIHGTGSATIDASTWNERDVMIAEGGDEWFRTEYIVNFNTNMTNYSGSYVRVTIVDKEGWHDTRDFPVSI